MYNLEFFASIIWLLSMINVNFIIIFVFLFTLILLVEWKFIILCKLLFECIHIFQNTPLIIIDKIFTFTLYVKNYFIASYNRDCNVTNCNTCLKYRTNFIYADHSLVLFLLNVQISYLYSVFMLHSSHIIFALCHMLKLFYYLCKFLR